MPVTQIELIAIGAAGVAALFFLLLLRSGRRAKRCEIALTETKNERRQTQDALERQTRSRESAEGRVSELEARLSGILSIEAEIAKLEDQRLSLENQSEAVKVKYAERRAFLDKLEQQVAVYDERLAFAELGVYEPHFDFTDSEAFKAAIQQVRQDQKEMISAKSAVGSNTAWTVGGSASKGQTMINRQIRLTLRAFNNECEAAIANVRWNNVNAMEKRILAAAKAIDTQNVSMDLKLNPSFIDMKLQELRLTHEYREKQKQEREERAELARAEREERKLLAEAEAAEKEEARYQKLLDKARREAGVDGGRIAELEAALAEAHATSERARAMAEMTRSGYVYIISNVGSFGEDVVKIGLTRRLDPDDRVKELGDASVPFGFDTHAMIYSDEAPALETALHTEFADRRINMANFRKEFFRVSLDEVEDAVTRLAPDAGFFKDREAQEWHETLARRNHALLELEATPDRLPDSI